MTRLSASLALFLVTLAAPAMAEGERLLRALDQNGDGAISRDEVLALRSDIFARVDADADGKVTKAEVDAAKAAAEERRRTAQALNIWALDTDGDGQLTLAEFTAATPGFDRADTNQDGVLTGDEITRITRLLGKTGDQN